MKKGNILIAVTAILTAASVARAGEIELDFDGGKNFAAQSLHSIFAAGHTIIPEGVLESVIPVPEPLIAKEDPTLGLLNTDWAHMPSQGQIEVLPGIFMDVYYAGQALVDLERSREALAKINATIQEPAVKYQTMNTGFGEALSRLGADRDIRVVYNGNRLGLQRVGVSKWVSDEALAAHSDHYESHPETHGHIEVAFPAHTLTNGTMGAASGTLAGAVMGAVYGFFQDVNDYVSGND